MNVICVWPDPSIFLHLSEVGSQWQQGVFQASFSPAPSWGTLRRTQAGRDM